MKVKIIRYFIGFIVFLFSSSCFTGIENTKKITDKDVAKVVQEKDVKIVSESEYNTIKMDTFPDWRVEKSFIVTDDNVKRVFSPTLAYDLDTLSLKGDKLSYLGYYVESVFDNEPKVNIRFSDGANEYVYPVGKTIEEIESKNVFLKVPFMVDMDMVESYNNILEGKYFYIRTSIWYDKNGVMIPGKKFIKVKILGVYPGDKIFPLRVAFETESGESAYLLMSTKYSSVQNRLFDNLFSITDIRLNYPMISDVNWKHIVNGTIALDMTKDECRLSLGSPSRIQERPIYEGLQEYWYYTDGMYLVFLDGLLKQYRK